VQQLVLAVVRGIAERGARALARALLAPFRS